VGWCEEPASKSSEFAAGQRGVDSRFARPRWVERAGEGIAYVRLAGFANITQRLGRKRVVPPETNETDRNRRINRPKSGKAR
jgi:hypothetical protein